VRVIDKFQGKPGYGKTTLTTLIIDHLSAIPTDSEGHHVTPFAYYFFDRQDNDAKFSYAAFRALLSQLVHMRRYDERVLDIAALSRSEHDAGQSFASDNEIFEILNLLLLDLGRCLLICDGVDECTNRDDFMKSLLSIASDHSQCHMILVTRPILKLPGRISRQCDFLDLDITRNMEDIYKYVDPQIDDLIESGDLVLPGLVSKHQVVDKIVSKASGMFLWANLFMDYLRLPSLTISDRLRDFEDSVRFKGLHNLYGTIFDTLQRNFPETSGVKLRKALKWVCYAMRPLHVKELQVAIEIEPKKTLGPNDVIPNFEQAIGPMSGSLLELTANGTVRLIHMTLLEYLVATSHSPSSILTALFPHWISDPKKSINISG
jgi:hypothetical protein